MSGVIYHDKCFMMDPPSRFLDTPNAGKQTTIMSDRLKQKKIFLFILVLLDKRYPDVVEFHYKK